MKTPILVLLPSIRPAAMVETIRSLTETGEGLHDILTIREPGIGIIAAFNTPPMELLLRYRGVLMFNDDARMRTPGWDRIVSSWLEKNVGIIYGRDGIWDESIPIFPCIHTAIISALGYVCPPSLHHWHGDIVLRDVTRAVGCLHYDMNLFAEHLHAGQRGIPEDSVSLEQQTWRARDDAELERIKAVEIPQAIERVKRSLSQLNPYGVA